jgi:hypothetical protein
MEKGDIVGNIFFINVKDKGRLHISKIKIVGNIIFSFLMLNLDTLYLKEFLL